MSKFPHRKNYKLWNINYSFDVDSAYATEIHRNWTMTSSFQGHAHFCFNPVDFRMVLVWFDHADAEAGILRDS